MRWFKFVKARLQKELKNLASMNIIFGVSVILGIQAISSTFVLRPRFNSITSKINNLHLLLWILSLIVAFRGEYRRYSLFQESLEARVLELERALEAEQRSGQRERLAVTRLQRQLARVSQIHRTELQTAGKQQQTARNIYFIRRLRRPESACFVS